MSTTADNGTPEDSPEEPGHADDSEDTRTHSELRRILEAVIMVTEDPVHARLLSELTEVAQRTVEETLREMASAYEEEGRGFRLVEVAGGWRFQSDEWAAPYVERFLLAGQSARLSAAALETLAIVAYKQPISRAQVAAIRGVGVDGVIRTLMQRGYITEIGQDPGPGQATLFGTTSSFLERVGLNSIEELPSLGDFIPEASVVEMLEHGLRLDPEDPEPSGDTERSGDTELSGDTERSGDTELSRDTEPCPGDPRSGAAGGSDGHNGSRPEQRG